MKKPLSIRERREAREAEGTEEVSQDAAEATVEDSVELTGESTSSVGDVLGKEDEAPAEGWAQRKTPVNHPKPQVYENKSGKYLVTAGKLTTPDGKPIMSEPSKKEAEAGVKPRRLSAADIEKKGGKLKRVKSDDDKG